MQTGENSIIEAFILYTS